MFQSTVTVSQRNGSRGPVFLANVEGSVRSDEFPVGEAMYQSWKRCYIMHVITEPTPSDSDAKGSS